MPVQMRANACPPDIFEIKAQIDPLCSKGIE